MYAIRLNEENLGKILQRRTISAKERIAIDNYIRNGRWYFVIDYRTLRGKHFDWTTLPKHYVEDKFEYNPETIERDWTHIFRK